MYHVRLARLSTGELLDVPLWISNKRCGWLTGCSPPKMLGLFHDDLTSNAWDESQPFYGSWGVWCRSCRCEPGFHKKLSQNPQHLHLLNAETGDNPFDFLESFPTCSDKTARVTAVRVSERSDCFVVRFQVSSCKPGLILPPIKLI